MSQKILMGTLLCMVLGSASVAQDTTVDTAIDAASQTEEAVAWEIVKDSEASADVFAFIEKYPNGSFIKEAKARMIDLLWVEMAAETPAPAPAEPETQQITAVTFSGPLTEGAPEIVGKSIETLIEGTPLFPPIEGLPEEYWIAAECSDCHAWEKANLCDQANSYLSDAGAVNLVKPHPYGGSFKQNLRTWGAGGCE